MIFFWYDDLKVTFSWKVILTSFLIYKLTDLCCFNLLNIRLWFVWLFIITLIGDYILIIQLIADFDFIFILFDGNIHQNKFISIFRFIKSIKINLLIFLEIYTIKYIC
jgi:hypothetical protein